MSTADPSSCTQGEEDEVEEKEKWRNGEGGRVHGSDSNRLTATRMAASRTLAKAPLPPASSFRAVRARTWNTTWRKDTHPDHPQASLM